MLWVYHACQDYILVVSGRAISRTPHLVHATYLQAELSADTPAERLLLLLEGLVEGVQPPLNVLAGVIASLRTRQDLYAPSNLGQRIREAGMDVSLDACFCCSANCDMHIQMQPVLAPSTQRCAWM